MQSAIYQNKPIETVGKEWTWVLRIDGDSFNFDCDDPDKAYNETIFPKGKSCCHWSCCTKHEGIRDQESYTIASFYTDMDSNYDTEKTIDDWLNGKTPYHSFGIRVLDVQIRAVFSNQVI